MKYSRGMVTFVIDSNDYSSILPTEVFNRIINRGIVVSLFAKIQNYLKTNVSINISTHLPYLPFPPKSCYKINGRYQIPPLTDRPIKIPPK